MTDFSADKVVWSSRVHDTFGPVVELSDEQGQISYYTIEKEFDVAGNSYAVLISETRSDVQGPEIFRIITTVEGTLELVTIDDDDEWENVSELYDELTFPE